MEFTKFLGFRMSRSLDVYRVKRFNYHLQIKYLVQIANSQKLTANSQKPKK
jgi:hypothetical protein